MKSISPVTLKVPELQRLLQSVIAPRPICFASTISADGIPNLAPFSFFNLFSSNPPIVVFSPALSGRTGQPKDTLLNLKEVPEVAVNIVTYPMVHAVSLASSPYPRFTDEFVKSGFTPLPSEKIKPPRVKESPVHLECVVKQIIPLGDQGGAGNLIIAEVVLIHINENIFDENQKINPAKLELVARLGDNWYLKVTPESLFEIEKPITTIGIGIDALPEKIKNSKIFNHNQLAQLASVEKIPEKVNNSILSIEEEPLILAKAARLLDENKIQEAWQLILNII
ncbi:MAG: flavin reductase family protein [Bacteroidia bacterium]|nr:flavin reductase family protein [Bacteroidia bacterium]